MINALTTQLQGAKSPDCQAYHQVLVKARVANPSSITNAAARRAPCTPPPKCNADLLTEKGTKAYNANVFSAALAFYEAAYGCKPTSDVLRQELMSACNLHDSVKAKFFWKRLPLDRRSKGLLSICERNGIAEATLTAP